MGTHDLRLRLAQIEERDGRRHAAMTLYAQVLCGNPYLLEAWWGLSQTVADPAQTVYCLKRVLALNPCHAEARQRLEQMTFDVMAAGLWADGGRLEAALASRTAALDTPIFN